MRRVGWGNSIRARLLLAFAGVAALVLVAAAAGFWSLRVIGNNVDSMMRERTPAALAALDFSRNAERLLAAAPTLLAASNPADLQRANSALDDAYARLQDDLAPLRDLSDGRGPVELETGMESLRENLNEAARLTASRIDLEARRIGLTRDFARRQGQAQRQLTPGLLALDERLSTLREALVRVDEEEDEHTRLMAELGQTFDALMPQQNVSVALGSLNDLLVRTIQTTEERQVAMLVHPLLRTVSELRDLIAPLPDDLRTALAEPLDEMARLIQADDGIVSLRRQELELATRAQAVLAENAQLSTDLSEAVDARIDEARQAITSAAERIAVVRNSALSVQLLIAGLSMLASALIVWLYVDRSITRRLSDLIDSTLSIAEGNLRAPLPPADTRDEIGHMARALHVFRDTAVEIEDKNLREVAQAQQRLLDAIESISEGFALFDAQGALVLANSRYARMLRGVDDQPFEPGETMSGILAQLARDGRLSVDDADSGAWSRALAEGGGVREIKLGARWLRIGERRVGASGTVVILSDISPLKEREHLLEQARDRAMDATRTKSQFLANMSHELRTPLNAVIGISEMLREDAEDDEMEEYLEPLDRIRGAGKHLLGLINEILDLSKIEAGRLELAPEPVDLASLLRDVLLTARPLADRNANRLEDQIAPDLGTIIADPMRLRQILLNLLSNACKFTENGLVHLSAVREERDGLPGFRVAVRDSGIGMTPEQLGKLFQDFAQADATTSRKYGGTGLGLAISRRLAMMMGGDVTVVSAPGEGSEFTLWLPEGGVPEAGDEPADDRETDAAARGRTVLVVDDDPDAREVLRRILTAEGLEVTTAADADEAFARLHESRPAMITLDVMMPGTDGWALLRQIKSDPAMAEIPVAMVTILDEQNRAFALGAADFVTKPVDAERLKSVLNRHGVGRRRPLALMVEDDADQRLILRRVLESAGWDALEAEDGVEGLEILDEGETIDLILLDLMMPRLDGFGFVARMRERPAGSAPPIVVITAADLSEDDRKRLDDGVQSIMGKSDRLRDELLAALALTEPQGGTPS